MIKYTQTNLSPGNFHQTCIASLLDIDPLQLPDQVTADANISHPSSNYTDDLGIYLRRHFGLLYFSEPIWKFGRDLKIEGYHCISGETERTPTNNRNHVVIGLNGKEYWDPHPSRKFLTKPLYYGILIDFPNNPGMKDLYNGKCKCPECLNNSLVGNEVRPEAIK